MIVSKFKIGTDHTEPERWFWVRIYDTPQALQKVAQRVKPVDSYADALGTVQETTPWVPEESVVGWDELPTEDLLWPENGFAGVIRLCADWLTDEILTHEILHAAVVVFRMNISLRPLLEGPLAVERNREEALAYAVGQLAADLYSQLEKRGLQRVA